MPIIVERRHCLLHMWAHPKPSVTLTSMPAIPVTPTVGKSWRITEKAPPQPSKRGSFFKGTLEQARLAGLTDEEIASIAAALKPLLEKEEKSGDPGRSVKRGVLPETCSSRTIKRGKAVLAPSSNHERVTPGKHDVYCAHDHLTHAGSTSTSTRATVTVPSTESSTAATTQTAVTITRTRKPPAPPPATQFFGYWTASASSRSGRNAACADAQDQNFGPFQRRHGHC